MVFTNVAAAKWTKMDKTLRPQAHATAASYAANVASRTYVLG